MYMLFRILGNDLPPRHSSNQTLKNLEFILNTEEVFPNCEKRFIVNRILDIDTEASVLKLLEKFNYRYKVIPFIPDQYLELENYNERVAYLTNVNYARNRAIKEGLEIADYVLPLDGASFFPPGGWVAFDTIVRANEDPFFAINQARSETYEQVHGLIEEKIWPEIMETYHFGDTATVGVREYAVAFGKEADVRYNDRRVYPEADKVELLYRLGLRGPWINWLDIEVRAKARMSYFAGNVKEAGWLVRLPSGNPTADGNNLVRGAQRIAGLQNLVRKANQMVGVEI